MELRNALSRGRGDARYVRRAYTLLEGFDNDTDYVILGQHATKRSFHIRYEVELAVSREVQVGEISIETNGVTAAILAHEFDGEIAGLSFGADVNGADVRLSFTKTAVGEATNFFYRIDRDDPSNAGAAIGSSIPWATSAPLTLYVDRVSGDDDNGDGSLANPYQTFTFLGNLPPKIRHQVKVKPLVGGTYTVFPETVGHEWVDEGRLILDATGLTYPVSAGPFTVQSVSGVGAAGPFGVSLSTDLQVTGAPGWTPDEHWGLYIHFTSGNYAGQVIPIWKNTSDTIRVLPDWLSLLATPMQAGDTFNIVDCPVVIDVPHRVRFVGATQVRSQYIFNKENDALINPHLIVAGFRFRGDPGAPNPFTVENLNCALVFTTFQDAWNSDQYSVPLHSYDALINIKNANITAGTLDNQLVISDWYGSLLLLGLDGAIPAVDGGTDLRITRGGVSGAFMRRRLFAHDISFENIFGSFCGGVEFYGCPRILVDHLYIEQIGFSGIAVDLKHTGGRFDAIWFEACLQAMVLREGTNIYGLWLRGNTTAGAYGTSLRRSAQLWISSNTTVVGATGAVQFIFGGTTHVGWPAAGVALSDGAGSFVGRQ